MRAIGTQVQADPGRVKGADLIEQVAVTSEPITR